MTGLQMYLAVAGVVLVLIFFLAGRFQEYRHRKKTNSNDARNLSVHSDDGPNDFDEPEINLFLDENEPHRFSKKEGGENKLIPQDEAIHPRFEWSVLFSSDQDIQYNDLLDAIHKLKKLYGQPVWQLFETDSKLWIEIDKFDDSQSYRYVRVIMPVSSRSGPLVDARWQEVMAVLREFAASCGLIVKTTKEVELFDRARQVEEFCANVDVMIGMTILFAEQSSVSMKKIREFIEEKGLKLGQDGLFHAFNVNQEEIYSLGDKDQRPILDIDNSGILMRGLTLIIDIPQVKDVAEALTDAYTCANELVANFGGVVVDDNLKPLGLKQIESIKKQMEKIHQDMHQFGIAPGDVIAKKLFAM